MRKTVIIALMCLVVTTLFAQTTPNTPIIQDWENGLNGWETSNHTQNAWSLGTAIVESPTHSMYISTDNGTTHGYNQNTQATSYLYKEVTFPSDFTDIVLSFDIHCIGDYVYNEVQNTTTVFDFVRVFLQPYDETEDNAPVGGSGTIDSSLEPYRIGEEFYYDISIWKNITISLLEDDPEIDFTDYQGQTYLLIFAWRNNSSGSNGTPAAIDNISLHAIATDYPPLPTTLGYPRKGDNMIPVLPTLTWTASTYSTAPTAYTVYFDTANPPVDTVTPDNDSSYTPPADLDFSQTYYWKVVPNDTDETYCPVWSFTTIPEYTATVGTGIEQSYAPVYTPYRHTVSEMIYTKEELADAGFTNGVITQISFRANLQAGISMEYGTNNFWRVFMGETSQDTFSDDNWIPESQMTQVLNDWDWLPDNDISAGQWLEITLNQPFIYSGQNNLVIYVNELSPDYLGDFNGINRWMGTCTDSDSNTRVNRTIFSYTDSDTYMPWGGTPWTVTSGATLSPSNIRPNLSITYEPKSEIADLGIASFTVPAKIPGTEEMLITVMNFGTVEAEPSDYVIEIFANGQSDPLYTITPTEPLPAFDNNVLSSYTYSISPSEYNIRQDWENLEGWVNLQAKVTFLSDSDVDENPSNDYNYAHTTIRPDTDIAIVSFKPIDHQGKLEIVVENNGWEEIDTGDYQIVVHAQGNYATAEYTISGTDAVALPITTQHIYYIEPSDLSAIYGDANLHVEIVRSNDGDNGNNHADTHTYLFQHVAEVGTDGTITSNNIPFSLAYRDNISQSIYTAAELGGQPGLITHINYKVNMVNQQFTNFPVMIFMANDTERTTFADTNDWEPMNSFTQVIDWTSYWGHLSLPIQNIGTYDFWIPLDQPFMYEGDNLIVMTYKEHSEYPGQNNVFFQTPIEAEGVYVTLHKQSDNEWYDPWDIENSGAGYLQRYKPQTRFALRQTGLGIVSGIVDDGDLPLEGVYVGSPSSGTHTNENGQYSITVDKGSDGELYFERGGYVRQSFLINTLGWTPDYSELVDATTKNVTMVEAVVEPVATFTLTGTVRYADTEAIVPNVIVHLQRNWPYYDVLPTVTTNNSGVYELDYAPVETELYVWAEVNEEGYENSGENLYIVSLDDPVLVNGVYTRDITIQEHKRPPDYVFAYPTGEPGEIKIEWTDPFATYDQRDFSHRVTDDYASWFGNGYYIAAMRFSAEQLAEKGVAGYTLTDVYIPPVPYPDDFCIMIWIDDDLSNPDVEHPTYTQAITQELHPEWWYGWNGIRLNKPLIIPENGELVIGISSYGNQMPISGYSHQEIDGYGNKYYHNGAWTTIDAASSGQYRQHWQMYFHAISLVEPPEPMRQFAHKYSVYRIAETGGVGITDPEIHGPDGTYIDDLFVIDNIDVPGRYRYAVRSVFSGSGYTDIQDEHVDEYTTGWENHSMVVSMDGDVEVTVYVSANGLQFPEGAVVSIYPGALSQTIESGEFSTNFTLFSEKQYRVTVFLPDYSLYQDSFIFYEDRDIWVALNAANVIYHSNGDGWINLDVDNDDYFWRFGYDVDGPDPYRYIAFSESHLKYDVDLKPDNWLISPPIYLPLYINDIQLQFSTAPNSRAKAQERLFAYLTTQTADWTPDWSDFIDEPHPSNQYDGWVDESTVSTAELIYSEFFSAGDNTWRFVGYEMSSYAGETVRLAIRHAHSVNQDMLKLADIMITVQATAFTVTGEVTYDADPPEALEGISLNFINTTQPQYSVYGVTTETDGVYSTPIQIGLYRVEVYGDIDGQYYNYTLPEIIMITSDDTVDIHIPVHYSVAGTIQTNDDPPAPVDRALITLTSTVTEETPNPGYVYTTRSNPDGEFTFPLVATGDYNLTVSGSHFYNDYIEIPYSYVYPDNPIEVDEDITDIELFISSFSFYHTVSGTILTSDNQPIVNAEIYFYNQQWGEFNYMVFSNDEGAFTFPQIFTGPYYIHVSGYHEYPYGYPYGWYEWGVNVLIESDMLDYDIIIDYLSGADEVILPIVTALKSNYPNPFNPSTTIGFDMAREGRVSIDIYNIKGQKVKTLTNDSYGVGRYSVVWNGDDLNGRSVGSGVYFYRMTTNGYSSVKKMLLMK